MSRTTRLALVAACAAAAALIAGCAAGQSAATLQIRTNYAAGSVGDVQAQNLVVVVDPSTNAAQLTGTVVNDGNADDQLTQVTIDGRPVTMSAVDVAPHGTANLAASNGGTKLVLSDSTSKPGVDSPVTLTFANGGTVQVTAETDANTGIYAGFSPSS